MVAALELGWGPWALCVPLKMHDNGERRIEKVEERRGRAKGKPLPSPSPEEKQEIEALLSRRQIQPTTTSTSKSLPQQFPSNKQQNIGG
ncbi:hypothetical protein Nepgr_004419 [Nepenthes gracilis]|uniref:Uncharacterized protein n=1 Tax=Nepenthes gracilis TaxID=150966 RepID=A0AAD3XF73_NEPGR|nr:hypothetical protein Nepgr_004419 [Nepenthes gracilis]